MTFEFVESEYNTNLPVKYVFYEGKRFKDRLIVIFSGFGPPGSEIKYVYNYMRALKDVDCNRLYILDNYGPRGCYYLGSNGGFEVESSTVSLITYIINKYNVKMSDVIAAGSSKGGSAAMYFGLKYNFGRIIVGAPQIFIGDYVRMIAKETALFMMGENPSADVVEHYNRLIFNQLNKDIIPGISILSGLKDRQYHVHIAPFIKECKAHGFDIDLELEDRINSHGDIGTFFPFFMIRKIIESLLGLPKINPEVVIGDGTLNFLTGLNGVEDVALKHRMVENEEMVLETKSDIVDRDIRPGLYDLFTDVYMEQNKIFVIPYGRFLIGGDQFFFRGYEMGVDGDQVFIDLDVISSHPIRFAFYLMKGKLVIEKRTYQDEPNLRISVKEKGSYFFRFFIMTSDGKKIVHQTHTVNYE